MKKVVLFIVYLMTFAIIYSCGNQAKDIATMAAEKAIAVYIEDYVGAIDIEEVKMKVMEKREMLPALALKRYLTDESIKELGYRQRIEHSVLLTIAEVTGTDPGAFGYLNN